MKILFKLLIISLFFVAGMNLYAQDTKTTTTTTTTKTTEENKYLYLSYIRDHFEELKSENVIRECNSVEKMNKCLIRQFLGKDVGFFVTSKDIQELISLGASPELIEILVKSGQRSLFDELRSYINDSSSLLLIEDLSQAKFILKEALAQLKYYTSSNESADFLKMIEFFQESVYLRQGIIYSEQGRFDQAIDEFNEIIKINPKSIDAFYNRGNAFFNKGIYEKSISDYDEALKLKSYNPNIYLVADIYVYRGNIFFVKGDYKQSIKDFTEAIELNPNLVLAYYNRGLAYLKLKENQSAINDFNKVLSLEFNFAEAYYNRGNTYKLLGEKEKAEADLKMYNELLLKNETYQPLYELIQNPSITSSAIVATTTTIKTEVVQNPDGNYSVIEYPVDKEVTVELAPFGVQGAKGWSRVLRKADGTTVVIDLSGLPTDSKSYYIYAVDPAGKMTLLGPTMIKNGISKTTFTTPMSQFMLVLSPNEGLTALNSDTPVAFRSQIPTGYAVVPTAIKNWGANQIANITPAIKQVADITPAIYEVPILNVPKFAKTTEVRINSSGDLLGLKGKACIDSTKGGVTKIKMHFDDIDLAPKNKRFILWAASPDGKYTKLGQVNNTGKYVESEIRSETALTNFGLFITVEDANTNQPTSRVYAPFNVIPYSVCN